MSKPELTDKILETLVTLTMLNERARGFYKFHREYFPVFTEELHDYHYKHKLKPVLEPFADHYPKIKKEMTITEQLYSKGKLSKVHPIIPG